MLVVSKVVMCREYTKTECVVLDDIGELLEHMGSDVDGCEVTSEGRLVVVCSEELAYYIATVSSEAAGEVLVAVELVV